MISPVQLTLSNISKQNKCLVYAEMLCLDPAHISDSIFRLGATLSVLREKQLDVTKGNPVRRVSEVLVRRVPENQQVPVFVYYIN